MQLVRVTTLVKTGVCGWCVCTGGTHTHALTYTYRHKRTLKTHTRIHTHTHTHTYTHTYTYTHAHIHSHIHIHTYTHTHIHTRIHTQIHTRMHANVTPSPSLSKIEAAAKLAKQELNMVQQDLVVCNEQVTPSPRGNLCVYMYVL